MSIRSTIPAIPDSQHRFSERVFRRFESDLLSICSHYPKTVTIHPSGMHAETYRARIKDSMRAYAASTWESLVDRSKINFILHNCHIVVRGASVIIGVPGSADLPTLSSSVNSSDQRNLSIQIPCENSKLLEAAIVLSSSGVIPNEIELINPSPMQINLLNENPNLTLAEREGKYFLI